MSSPLVRVRSLALAAALATPAACGTSSTASSPVLPSVQGATNREFDLAVGQRATVGAPSVSVRFDTVTADSRCPTDALCVWAGDAALRFTITVGDAPSKVVELHSFIEPRSVTDAGVTVELLRVTPATDSRKPIALKDYRARLIVRDGN
ncbi:MAG TPA: hypothetical protein PKC83_05980 [Gemmatimonadaceae bacterium]|nr:hypothetical protein [Gemmatimonadaceae bacterium]